MPLASLELGIWRAGVTIDKEFVRVVPDGHPSDPGRVATLVSHPSQTIADSSEALVGDVPGIYGAELLLDIRDSCVVQNPRCSQTKGHVNGRLLHRSADRDNAAIKANR